MKKKTKIPMKKARHSIKKKPVAPPQTEGKNTIEGVEVIDSEDILRKEQSELLKEQSELLKGFHEHPIKFWIKHNFKSLIAAAVVVIFLIIYYFTRN